MRMTANAESHSLLLNRVGEAKGISRGRANTYSVVSTGGQKGQADETRSSRLELAATEIAYNDLRFGDD
jgi:hypothetical protein